MKNVLGMPRGLARLIPLLALGAAFAFAHAQAPQDSHLKFALVLTRHGVRSPTWTNVRLDEYSKDPWPKWDVAPGWLTAHGKTLMTQFGAFYRLDFSARGLLSPAGCSDAGEIYIRADTDERTLETGRGLADGMLPGCDVKVHSPGEGVRDSLFHAAGVGKPDAALAFAAVAGRIGADPSALLPAFSSQLTRMQRILSACTQQGCDAPEEKELLAVAPSLNRGAGEHLVELKGPLETGATFAENFQLEYLQGMPLPEVGWGRVDEETMRSLMAIHAASSDIRERTPYIAQAQASNLLAHMLRTMEQAERQERVAGALGNPGDKVVFLVGHDTNITSVAALLDAHWLIAGYQPDDAAPGGALVFELWQRAGGEDSVRVYYTVQTPEQMRLAEPLTPSKPPGKAVVFLPQCGSAGDGSECGWSRFQGLLQKSINSEFVR